VKRILQHHGRGLALGGLAVLLVFQAVLLHRSGLMQRFYRADPAAAAPPPGNLDILPSLKGRMARLEVLMNRLFRDIDDPAKSAELAAITREMSEHLNRAGQFTPEKVEWMIDAEEERDAMKGFRACLARARDQLTRLGAALGGKRDEAPKAVLLELDTTRRTCHAEFG
jgi:hypothetical protein